MLTTQYNVARPHHSGQSRAQLPASKLNFDNTVLCVVGWVGLGLVLQWAPVCLLAIMGSLCWALKSEGHPPFGGCCCCGEEEEGCCGLSPERVFMYTISSAPAYTWIGGVLGWSVYCAYRISNLNDPSFCVSERRAARRSRETESQRDDRQTDRDAEEKQRQRQTLRLCFA